MSRDQKIARIQEILSILLFDQIEIEIWLNLSHPSLQNQTPQSFIDRDSAGVDYVLQILENVIEGQPA